MKTTTLRELLNRRRPLADGRGCPHAHQQLAHLVGRQKSQGVAADVGHGDVGGGKGLFDGVKSAAVAASRAHLRRPVGRRRLRFCSRCRLDHIRPGGGHHLMNLVRRVLTDPVLRLRFTENFHRKLQSKAMALISFSTRSSSSSRILTSRWLERKRTICFRGRG